MRVRDDFAGLRQDSACALDVLSDELLKDGISAGKAGG